MNKEFRERISEKLKEKTMKFGKKSGVRLPGGFIFSENPEMLTLRFSSESGMGLGRTYCNMQDDNAAFEGWALAIYVHYLDCKGKVCLDIPAEDKVQPHSEDLYTEFPHYSRFLYRVLRFSEQYPWFVMSAELKKRVDAFRKFLEENPFTNNVPSDEAGEKEKLESIVESRFAEDCILKEKLKTDKVYRQLPVGLFRGERAKANRIFTGKSSAIDLWAVSGDVLTVMELKAGGNKKMGAVTELFFYANYVYDMFVKQDNSFHPDTKGNDRGYPRLLSEPLKKVRAYLLLDEESRHPLITDAILKELSREDITYDCIMYQMDADVKVTLHCSRE